MQYPKINHALILAAGFGSRLMPTTKTTPKCLVEVGGTPMLAQTLKRLDKIIPNIFINTHYLHQKVMSFTNNIAHTLTSNINIFHEPQILGTGGTIKQIANNHNINNILIHNADAYFTGAEFLHDFIASRNSKDLYLALYPKNNVKWQAKGDFDYNHKSGKITPHKGGEYIYTGLAIINCAVFADFNSNKFALTDVIDSAQNLDIGGYILPKNVYWYDIGTHQRLSQANQHANHNGEQN